MKKTENIHERDLRSLYSDSTSPYENLLYKAKKGAMGISRLKTLCIENLQNNLNAKSSFYARYLN